MKALSNTGTFRRFLPHDPSQVADVIPIRGSHISNNDNNPVDSAALGAALPAVRRRYGSLLAGAFLISITLALAAAAETSTLSQQPKHNQQSSPAVSAQAAQEESTMPTQNPAGALPEDSNNVAPDTTSGSATNQSNVHVQVSVNGQSVAVPANGSTTQTIPSDDGTTTVRVDHSQSSTGSSSQTSVTSQSTGSSSFSLHSESGSSPP